MTTLDNDHIERIHENRDALTDLANSDLPVAWAAAALLDAADGDRDHDREDHR